MVQLGRSGAAASQRGVVLGLALSFGALRAMHSALYGVGAYDPLSLTAVVLTLVLVTLLAIILPTLKIARIDPATTLREE
jgi:ABC-type antimicrobial peptide transport system permease subunit